MNACRQRRQAMKGEDRGHAPPTGDSDRKQLVTPEKGRQAHAPRLEDVFYSVIYTARAPGKVSPLQSYTPFLLLSVSGWSDR